MVSQRRPSVFGVLQLAMIGIAIAIPGGAIAATGELVQQQLDRLDAFSRTAAQNILPAPPVSYAVSGTAFSSCQNTSTRGMYCLDGNSVRRWSKPETSSSSTELFSCANPLLGLDKGGVCTALAVDLAGNIWLAGKKNNAYSLIKVVEGTSCPGTTSDPPSVTSSWVQITPSFCAREYASGRPLLLDLSVVDGDVADSFPLGAGIIGVEERKTVTFFSDSPQAPSVTIGSGKAWGLAGNEQLQGATLLQRNEPTFTQNWVLVTTSNGRLLAKNVPFVGQSEVAATDTGSSLVATTSTCTGPLPSASYDVRSSIKTGKVYASDRRGCRVVSTVPTYGSVESDWTVHLQPLTVEQSALPPPEGISVSPGVYIDLKKCVAGTGCTLIPDNSSSDGNTYDGAALSYVVTEGSTADMTLFQVKNIPDCRFVSLPECTGTILGPANQPENQYLNVAPLLPPEIKSLFPAGLPQLLLSPQYRARQDSGANRKPYRFDALFGVPKPGVQFRNTFTATFDVADLLGGTKLGCGGLYKPDGSAAPQPNTNWDVVVTISERYPVVGGPSGPGLVSGTPSSATIANKEYVDVLVNRDGCFNPTSGSGGRWSMYAYGLELMPDKRDTSNALVYPDSVFAHLVTSLADALGETQDKFVCYNVDSGTNGAPLSSTSCTALQSSWLNTRDKLDKCVEASTHPKTSAGAQNCQAFETQFAGYVSTLKSQLRQGSDPANRIGELVARTDVLWHVYATHFLPSVPDGGFIDP